MVREFEPSLRRLTALTIFVAMLELSSGEVKHKMKLTPEHVKGARGMLNLSQADLARAAGVSESTVRFFESERTTPNEDTLWRLQRALEERGITFTNGDRPGITLDRGRAAAQVRDGSRPA